MEAKPSAKRAYTHALWAVFGVVLIAVVWASFFDTYKLLSYNGSVSRYRYALVISLTYLLARRVHDEWTRHDR